MRHLRAILSSPLFVGVSIAVLILGATAEAPPAAEAPIAEAAQAEDMAYRRGLEEGARLARLNCGKPLTVTRYEP